MAEKISQNITNTRLINPVYFQMFRAKLLGLTYKQIADQLGYAEGSVRHIFTRGGPLYEYWQDWKREQMELSADEAMEIMFGHTPQIVRTMAVSAERPHSMVGFLAGAKILEYTLGKPEEKVKVSGGLVFATIAELIEAVTKDNGSTKTETGNSNTVAERSS